MSADYTTPNLRQSFVDRDSEWVRLTPAELEQMKQNANPLEIQTRDIVFTDLFTLEDFKKGTPTIKFDGVSNGVFSVGHKSPMVADALANMDKRPDLDAEVPKKAMITSLKISLLQSEMPLLVEGSFVGIDNRSSKGFTNNCTDGYKGHHFIMPAGKTKFFEPGKEKIIHTVDDVLDLESAVELQSLTPADIDACMGARHMLPLQEGDTELVEHCEVDVKMGNALHKAIKGPSGEGWLGRQLPSHSQRVELAPGNPLSPVRAMIPLQVMNKIRDKVAQGNLMSEKHLKPVDLTEFAVNFQIASKKGLSGPNIQEHKLLKSLDARELEIAMKKPYNVTVAAHIEYIPL
jgi:hypothetical protein